MFLKSTWFLHKNNSGVVSIGRRYISNAEITNVIKPRLQPTTIIFGSQLSYPLQQWQEMLKTHFPKVPYNELYHVMQFWPMRHKKFVGCVWEFFLFWYKESQIWLEAPLSFLPSLKAEVMPGAVAAILESNGKEQENQSDASTDIPEMLTFCPQPLPLKFSVLCEEKKKKKNRHCQSLCCLKWKAYVTEKELIKVFLSTQIANRNSKKEITQSRKT